MKICTDFEFAGEMLSDYGMILCSFDSGGGIETFSSGADITFNQIKPIGSNRFNLYSSTSGELGNTILPFPQSSIAAKIVSPSLSGVVSTNFVPTR